VWAECLRPGYGHGQDANPSHNARDGSRCTKWKADRSAIVGVMINFLSAECSIPELGLTAFWHARHSMRRKRGRGGSANTGQHQENEPG